MDSDYRKLGMSDADFRMMLSDPDRMSNKKESDAEQRERERRKKRKSRWGGDEMDKAFILGMPTVLPTNLSKEQEEAYLLQLQIEEVSRKLRTGDLGIPANPEERSPSPEPIYSSDGKRLNTREFRTRKALEEERHNLIQKMLKVNPDFKPPADYKPPIVRVSDKVMIPQEEHPDINFVGLLIGPRGNTLKSMERETGAKIIIRGKGSVKEGKVGRKDGHPLPGEDEPLHAYVTANNPEFVKKAVDKIKEIIRQGVEVPEGQNDLRRMQLRELALLNGTLRENDGPRCSNCGAADHKSWLCPDKPNVTNSILCTTCGGAGHIAKDCRAGKTMDSSAVVSSVKDRAKIDEEYLSLMAELGEGPPPDKIARKMTSSSSYGSSLFDKPSPMRALTAAPPPPLSSLPPNLPPPPWNKPPPPDTSAPPPPPPVTAATSSMPPQTPPPWTQMPPPMWGQPMAPPPSVATTSAPPPPSGPPPPPTTMPPPGPSPVTGSPAPMPPWTQMPPPMYWPMAPPYMSAPPIPPPGMPNAALPPPPPPPDTNPLMTAPPPPPPPSSTV